MADEKIKTGSFSMGLKWNVDSGEWEKDDGHVGHSDLVTKCVSVATGGTNIFTVASGKKGYITYLQVVGTAGTDGIRFFENTTATISMVRARTGETVTMGNGVNPIIEVAEGIFKGDSILRAMVVTVSYYTKTVPS